MDLASMMQTMLNSDSIAQMSQRTNTSTDNVKSVLLSAMPAMLSGVQKQASGRNTVAGFAGALDTHAKDDTSDITAFLSNVDIQDGEKIVGHLLGRKTAATTKTAAKKAGLSTTDTGSILGTAAPLLMSLLGQQVTQAVQTQPQNDLPTGSAQQASDSGVGLLAGLIGSTQEQASANQSGIGGLFGRLFGGAKQQNAAGNPISSAVGSMLSGADVTSMLSGFLGSGE